MGIWTKAVKFVRLCGLAESRQSTENRQIVRKSWPKIVRLCGLAESRQSTELAETLHTVNLTKVGDWPKEPTDDTADRRKSRLAEERPDC